VCHRIPASFIRAAMRVVQVLSPAPEPIGRRRALRVEAVRERLGLRGGRGARGAGAQERIGDGPQIAVGMVDVAISTTSVPATPRNAREQFLFPVSPSASGSIIGWTDCPVARWYPFLVSPDEFFQRCRWGVLR